jgi:uncharacterized protein (TIGR02099 family)
MIHHISRATRHFLFLTIIIGAVFFSALRLILSEVKVYKSEMEARIGAVLDTRVKIGTLRGNMRGLYPELVLKDIDILQTGDEQPSIKLREIRLGLNLLDLIRNRQFFSATWVSIVGARLSVKRKVDGTIAIEGLKASDEPPLWLLQGDSYELIDSEVTWQDEKRQGPMLTFKHTDFLIENDVDAGLHQIHIILKLPTTLGDSLRLSMEFNGNIFEPHNINGSLYVEGNNIQIAEILSGEWPMQLQFDAGTSDFKLWSDWQNSQIISLMGEIKGQQVKLRLQDRKSVVLKNIASQFCWQSQPDHWRLDVVKLLLETENSIWTEAGFGLLVKEHEEQPGEQIYAIFSRLDLKAISEVILFSKVLDAEQLDYLQKLKLKGQIENFSLFVDAQSNKFAVSGEFQNIGLSAVDSLPMLNNFSGHVRGTEQSGYVHLQSANAQINFPGINRQSVQLDQLTGGVSWRQEAKSWQIESKRLQLNTPDFKSQNRLVLKIPKDQRGLWLDFQSDFSAEDATGILDYLPVDIMNKDLVEWLDSAILAGRVEHGAALIYGDIENFPFTNGAGVFETVFDAKAFVLAYHPQWAYIKDADAAVLFKGDGLRVDIHNAAVNGANLQQTIVKIPSFEKSDYVEAEGRIKGSIKQSIGFLRNSPLASIVDPIVEVITADGNNDIQLQLNVPLVNNLDVEVDGVAHLQAAQLVVLPLDLPVSQVHGDLRFNERGIYSEGIKAEALGYPVMVQIANQPGQTNINVTGHSNVDILQDKFTTHWWDLTKGELDYDVQLIIPNAKELATKLVLTSNLQGMSLTLPESLAKSAAQQRPFALKMEFSDAAFIPLTLNYDDQLQAALNIRKEDTTLYSGHIVYGEGNAALQAQPGFILEVNRDSWSLSKWMEFKEEYGADSLAEGHQLLKEVHIKTANFEWQNNEYGALELNLQKQEHVWLGNIRSRFAEGQGQLPLSLATNSKISLDMEFLDIPGLSSLNIKGNSFGPTDLPDIDIKSRHILVQTVDLGTLYLKMRQVSDGLMIDRFLIYAKDKKMDLMGSWRMRGEQSLTEVKGTLNVAELGFFLSQLNWTNDLKGAPATFDFSLQWAGAPYQFSLDRVQGKVQVNLGNGRLLGIEPGVGRLLGAFDLDQWLRRLRLDFSDLYAKGLTFDGVKGSFLLADGYADTDDLIIDAVAAKIEIRGKTGLVTRDFDQIVTVSPKSSSAIPFAGTIIGFMVDKLFGKHPDSYTRSQYAVTGGWGDPEVLPMHEYDGILRKAWTGLTNFPWQGVKNNR